MGANIEKEHEHPTLDGIVTETTPRTEPPENRKCNCPSGAVPVQSGKPTTNGCGPDWAEAAGLMKTIGFLTGGEQFTPCCNEHDRCYEQCAIGNENLRLFPGDGTAGKTKEECDDAFLSCMLGIVDGLVDRLPENEIQVPPASIESFRVDAKEKAPTRFHRFKKYIHDSARRKWFRGDLRERIMQKWRIRVRWTGHRILPPKQQARLTAGAVRHAGPVA